MVDGKFRSICAPLRVPPKLIVVIRQQPLTTYQTTFCEMPLPHTRPVPATARKMCPSVIPAAVIQVRLKSWSVMCSNPAL